MPITDINSFDLRQSFVSNNESAASSCATYYILCRSLQDYTRLQDTLQVRRVARPVGQATPAGTDQSIQIKFHFMQLTASVDGVDADDDYYMVWYGMVWKP